jgi:Raf kinase inhibitor-like YbhB/YbcL family protein
MQRLITFGFVIAALFALTAYVSGGPTMQISSSAFQDGGKIPLKYVMPGAGGQNVSVPLSWTGAPAETESFALAMVDPHPVARNWVHWLVIDIPKNSTSLPEGASGKSMPQGAAELQNSYGKMGYGGPQPPPGSGDHLCFTLCSERAKVDLAKTTNLALSNRPWRARPWPPPALRLFRQIVKVFLPNRKITLF